MRAWSSEVEEAEIEPLIERGLERYRPVLPLRAAIHFRHVVTFFLEVHPSASRWIDAIAAADPPAPRKAGARRPVHPELVANLAVAMGLRPKRMAEVEDAAEVFLHDAEGGMRFLSETTFPEHGTTAERRRALAELVELSLASLFTGLVAAIFRRYRADGKHEYQERLSAHFMWVVLLFRNFATEARDAGTFQRYFMQSASVRDVAKRAGTKVEEERERVLGFLRSLSAFVAEEAPRLERDVKVDPAALTEQSKPWAMTLLKQEMERKPKQRSKGRRRS